MLKVMKFVAPICAVLVAIAASHAEKAAEKIQVVSKASPQCDASSDCQQCPVEKAMAALPKLLYKVGTEKTTCPVEAGRIARKTKHNIEFAVGDKVFKEETVAFASLVDTTEKMVADFAKPKKCEASGNTFVAGKSLCCEESAGALAKLVSTAMDGVKVTYKVGKESVCCPDAAKALAKKSGEKVIQLVAGEKCGGCSTTTRLSIARAKYKAAVQAMLAAETKSESKTEASVEVSPS